MSNSENNPYSAGTNFENPMTAIQGGITPENAEVLKKFKQQILALGVLWIILGVLGIGFAALMFTGGSALQMGQASPPPGLPPEAAGLLMMFAGVLTAVGLAWLASGVFSLMKQIWAVYFGAILTGLSLIGNLLNLNLCTILILAVVLIQAIRVIMYAGQLNRAGIPLNS